MALSTEKFSIDEADLSDTLASNGDLGSGFSLGLYDSPQATNRILNQDWICNCLKMLTMAFTLGCQNFCTRERPGVNCITIFRSS